MLAVACAAISAGCKGKTTEEPSTQPGTQAASQPATPMQVLQAGVRKLPEGWQVAPLSLKVAPDGGFVVFEQTNPAPADPQKPSPRSVYFIVNISTWQGTPLLTLLPEDVRQIQTQITNVEPSANGQQLLVVLATGPEHYEAHVLGVYSGTSSKIGAARRVTAIWAGNDIAMSTHSEKGLDALSIVSPQGQVKRTLDVHVEPVGASADGGVLLVRGFPKDLKAVARTEDMPSASILTIDANGNVLREIGPTAMAGEKPVISAGGKYVAMQRQPQQAGQTITFGGIPMSTDPVETRHVLLVISTKGDEQVIHPSSAIPLSVNDSAQVVALSSVVPPGGTWVRLFAPGGESDIIAQGVRAAAVASGNLVAVSAGNVPIFGAMQMEAYK